MRHKVRTRTLGRQTGHRIAMLRNMATSLFEHEQINTTVTRAHELSRFAEDLISWARKANTATEPSEVLAYKRRVFREITNRDVAAKLFDVISKRYADYHSDSKCGGYTRIIRNGFRKGDGSEMAIIQLVTRD